MEHAFGRAAPFALGVEEELLLVDPGTGELAHVASGLLPGLAPEAGTIEPDVYEALVELASPISPNAIEGTRALEALRADVRAAGGTPLGGGIHPAGPFGEAPHVESPRYRVIGDQMRGLLRRTPTCALHVHVGMPDPETAIRACNRMRAELPVLQALAAHSPFWHGLDSGFATARAQLFRGYPRADIPRPFDDWADYRAATDEIVSAAGVADYTFLWWDIRPHPRLGTVEVRAMDAQSRLATVCGLAALVHALAAACADGHGAVEPAEALTESSFRAGRDGLDATVWWEGGMRPVLEVATAAFAVARPYAREQGAEDALEEVERVLRDGNGADRMRARHATGGMEAVLAGLVGETAERLYGYTRTTSPIRTHL